jgi:succinyl-diaminopimelate desuccinylase
MDRLTARTVELIDIPSPSLSEAEILAWIAARLPDSFTIMHEPGEWVVAQLGSGPGLVLAGHVDTVPEQGNLPARVDGGIIAGLGASDMKGGLAVMLELAEWLAGTGVPQAAGPGASAVTLLFFAREELAVALSPVKRIIAEIPQVANAELVVVLEPTACAVEVGCLGNIVATARFEGIACHSARPWLGRSALDDALPTLSRIAARAPVEVTVAGHLFTEVANVVGIDAGVADNVIPPVAELRVNYRYAPGREPAAAEAEVLELLGGATSAEIVSHAPAAAVPTGNRWVDALAAASGMPPRPKIAWTPVAEFAAAGIDAVNFGPGDPSAAHRADEWIETAALTRCFTALRRLIAEGA